MAQSAISAAVCSAKPTAIDHSATRCSERRLLTNANTEWIAAIRYAVRTASSRDRIGGVKSPSQGTALVASLVDELTASKGGHIRVVGQFEFGSEPIPFGIKYWQPPN